MNETRAKRNLPAWARYIVYPLVGMLVALVLNVPAILFPDTSIEALPMPPSPAQAISMIGNFGFHHSFPRITGMDGRSYYFQRFDPDLAWQEVHTPVEYDDAVSCDPGNQQRLGKETGSLKDCKQIQEWGEFCPGPTAVYGVDGVGGVWLLLTDTICTSIISLQAFLFAGIGLVAAVFHNGWIFIRHRGSRKTS